MASMNAAELEQFRPFGMLACGENHQRVRELVFCMSKCRFPIASVLLIGPVGSGKTAIAASSGIDFEKFTSLWMLSAADMLGMDETAKCRFIIETFKRASASDFGLLILDDIERIAGYLAHGDQFSFSYQIFNLLMTLIKMRPEQERKLLIIATTSKPDFLKACGLYAIFSFHAEVPALAEEDVMKVLRGMDVFDDDGDFEAAAHAMAGYPIKKVITLVETARSEIGQKVRIQDLLAIL